MHLGGDGATLSMVASIRTRFHEVWRFLTVGGVSTVVEFSLLNALVFLVGVGPVWAKSLATAVAMVNAYLGNRYWSFRHRPRTGAAREAGSFLVVNLVGIGIGVAVIAAGRAVIGLHGPVALNLANLAAVAAALVFRFWAYHHWVFPTEHAAARRGIEVRTSPAAVRERELVAVGAAR